MKTGIVTSFTVIMLSVKNYRHRGMIIFSTDFFFLKILQLLFFNVKMYNLSTHILIAGDIFFSYNFFSILKYFEYYLKVG